MAVKTIPWKALAIVSTATSIVLALLLPVRCYRQGLPFLPNQAPAVRIPLIGTEPIPTPSEAASKAPTETEMHNVAFHIDETTVLDIHQLRGEMVSKKAGTPLNFDNKLTFILRIDTGRIGMRSASLDNLMNRYVFGYANPPLRNLHMTISGKQLVQKGVIHKFVDLPFTMWADVSASHGMIRIHPTKMDIAGINGISLLKTFGQTMEKRLKLPHDRGVFAEGNDLLLDPVKILPPPQTELKLVDVRIEGNELVQVFDAGRHLPPLHPPYPQEKNWMYYRGGTLRMGKLLMVDADMQVVDTDPSDPFDFYIDRYNDQLVAGFDRDQTNYGLLVFMRDFDDLGRPLKAGEKRAPE